MNELALFQLLGDIDEAYVEAAEQPVKKRPALRVWLPVAVCAAAVLLALPLLRAVGQKAPALHSYVLSEQGGAADVTAQESGPSGNTGATETVDSAGGGESPNFTGEVVGGAAEPDPNAPAQQEALDAYQHLMTRFEAEYGPGVYPDWYGGAYIVNGNFLIVNIPHRIDEAQTDKSLYFQIQEWAESKAVGFGGVKYSLNELLALQAKVTALPELLALPSWGCGIDQSEGQVTLYLPSADEALLAALAKLDPADDAIRVSVDASQAIVTVGTDD